MSVWFAVRRCELRMLCGPVATVTMSSTFAVLNNGQDLLMLLLQVRVEALD